MYRFREPVSGFTHLAGVILGLVGLVWLVTVTRHTPAKMLSVSVYGISLILLYTASAALHLTRGSEHTILWLKRLDHAAIYVLIAGTYTPFCYNLLGDGARWSILGIIWVLAAIGVFYKLLFLRKGNYLSTLYYIGMGWLAFLALPHIEGTLPPGGIALIVGGGIVYSLGAVIFSIQKPNLHRNFGFHEIWHLFVLGGSALHFLAVARYVV